MSVSRRTLVGIWALTTLVVLGGALLYYRQIKVPLLAGRTEPAERLVDDDLEAGFIRRENTIAV
ncbi:MAG: hypothetical protein IH941_05005 [Acidobacteria bacterium]|nr:hypothetical protein [Acidobacteriota bacterium]